MRIRTIKPEFFTHEDLFDAERETGLPLRVAYAGLWCAADREGRFKWEPRRLGVSILPYDGLDFSRVLDALATRGFIVKYASGNREFGWIPSFTRHQVINNKERASELPKSSNIKAPDACPTREPRVMDACRKEGKGKEQGTGKEEADPRVAEFSAAYAAAYEECIGDKYILKPEDFGQLKNLLRGDSALSCDKFMEVFHGARDALASQRNAFHCGKSGSLKAYCSAFNDVRAELAGFASKNGTAHGFRPQPARLY